MKTMGGKRKHETSVKQRVHEDVEEVEEEVITYVIDDPVKLEEEIPEMMEPPQKRHKKHKHKRHKKKRSEEEAPPDPNVFDICRFKPVETSSHRISKPSLKLKIKLAEALADKAEKRSKSRPSTSSSPKVLEKVLSAVPSTSSSPISMNAAAALKLLANKKKKGGKGKESGTSSEEERWLDAIESGKLEEIDDELKKIKDPKLMTARQRAMFEKKTEKEPSPGGEQLMALPSGYKEKVVTEEMLQKRALKLQKRKQMAEEKREKDKKKTMERLLKKQESKATRNKYRPSKMKAPQITLHRNADGESISLPLGMEFPLARSEIKSPPSRPLCGLPGCSNLKKYSCSKTGVSLCSIECYKKNLINSSRGV